MQFYDIDTAGVQSEIESLSKRLRKLIDSAVNYHSLIQPGRSLHYKFYMGEKWQYPRLTDTSTLNGALTEGADLKPFLEFTAYSTVEPRSTYSPHYFSGDEQIIDRNIRYILLTPDDATSTDVEAHSPARRLSRIYGKLEIHTPVLLDTAREVMRRMGEISAHKMTRPVTVPSVENINNQGHVHHPWVEVKPGTPNEDAPQAVIIAMHWLQAGGAETWATETVDLAHQAGFIPIIITDRDSHQPWLTRPEFDDALVLTLTHPMQERVGDATVLRALFEQFSIRGVLVHHCQWVYDRLWWIKKYFPETPIMDSLHIVEYKFGGGYHRESLRYDQWIDVHHVISPQLEGWLTQTHHVDKEKVVVAPLVDLTANGKNAVFQKRHNDTTLTVAFVGRLARQKRLEAFMLLAHYMNKRYHGMFQFIMHGTGSMDIVRDVLAQNLGVKDCIEFRGDDYSVDETYKDSDVLVVSSVNEGITLTTMEALSAGIPVISTNVGSQYTLIPSQGLTRRSTRQFVRDAARSLEHIREEESERQILWEVEYSRLKEFSNLQTANTFVSNLLKEWKNK